MGFYLQDTDKFSGGVNIKSGSHKYVDLFSGRPINVPLKMGDLVFWKLTTTHSGNAARLKMFPEFPLPGRIQRSLQRFLSDSLFLPEHMKRMSVFCTYGRPGVHLDNFIKYINQGEGSLLKSRQSQYSQRAYELAQTAKVKLVDPVSYL
jgi:hypothetical protein